MLFNAKLSNCGIYIIKRTSSFWWNNDNACIILDQFVWVFIVLPHWSNISQVDMSLHSSTLYFPRELVFGLFLQCCMNSEERTKIICLVFGLTRYWIDPTIYHTCPEHACHNTTDTVMKIWNLSVLIITTMQKQNKNCVLLGTACSNSLFTLKHCVWIYHMSNKKQ